MSGHNKWSKIKHKKAASDAEKSKLFSKHVKIITLEAKKSGGNPESPGLKAAIDRAKKDNVPNENIERAVKKVFGSEGSKMKEITYETYGPGGVAVLIDALTDNKNKTTSEIKLVLSKNGLSLSEVGSAAWAFEKNNGAWQAKEETKIAISEEDKQKLESVIKELEDNEDVQEIYTNTKS